MYDWRRRMHSNDPNDQRIREKLNDYLMKRTKIVHEWDSVILNKCNGKKVLDIGGIAHNKKQILSKEWKHRKLKKVASYIVGVDIAKTMIEWINEEGYNFKYMDATSDEYLGEKFDVIFMGDIIEHVENIAGLLRFAKRHLDDKGVMLITTANPHYYQWVLQYFPPQWGGYGRAIDNMEHTCWISPNHMNELCYRAGLYLKKQYFVIPSTFPKGLWWVKYLPVEIQTDEFIWELCFGEAD